MVLMRRFTMTLLALQLVFRTAYSIVGSEKFRHVVSADVPVLTHLVALCAGIAAERTGGDVNVVPGSKRCATLSWRSGLVMAAQTGIGCGSAYIRYSHPSSILVPVALMLACIRHRLYNMGSSSIYGRMADKTINTVPDLFHVCCGKTCRRIYLLLSAGKISSHMAFAASFFIVECVINNRIAAGQSAAPVIMAVAPTTRIGNTLVF